MKFHIFFFTVLIFSLSAAIIGVHIGTFNTCKILENAGVIINANECSKLSLLSMVRD